MKIWFESCLKMLTALKCVKFNKSNFYIDRICLHSLHCHNCITIFVTSLVNDVTMGVYVVTMLDCRKYLFNARKSSVGLYTI